METLASRLNEVLDELSLEGDWNDRYRLLVAWGDEVEVLPDTDCVPETEVSGCSSPLWLKAWWEAGVLHVRGESPGILPKALVALVTRLFDGVGEVAGPAPAVLEPLGLNRNLSPTRYLVLERMVDRILTCPRSAE